VDLGNKKPLLKLSGVKMNISESHSKGKNGRPNGRSHNGKNVNDKEPITDGKTPKVHKSQPTKRIQDFKIGGKDSAGHMITDILASGNEFVIYEIETNEIRTN
jgi:hypothetical protein